MIRPSPEKSLVELNAARNQQITILLLKGLLSVVFPLTSDVLPGRFNLRRANRECTVAVLPPEERITDYLVHPFRGVRFEISQNIRKPVTGSETRKKMNMIGNSADLYCNTMESAKNASQIAM